MITYNDLYEALRRERYSEQLQPIIPNFVKEVSAYLKDKEDLVKKDTNMFSEEAQKNKKQLDNAVSIFKELILRRKKKLLDLAFVSASTGISKRDFEHMIDFEKNMFEEIMNGLGESDKKIEKILMGIEEGKGGTTNKLILFKHDADEFLDLEGNKLGPFKKGDIVNIPQEIANILIVDNKADPVDEE